MPAARGRDTTQQESALDAYIKLHRCTNLLRSRSTQFFAEHGLTYGQFATLEALYHVGPLCQKDIAVKVIDNLEKSGLVARRTSARDRRQKVVNLTAKGRALIGDIFPEHAGRITASLGALSVQEQQLLARLCKKLVLY